MWMSGAGLHGVSGVRVVKGPCDLGMRDHQPKLGPPAMASQRGLPVAATVGCSEAHGPSRGGPDGDPDTAPHGTHARPCLW